MLSWRIERGWRQAVRVIVLLLTCSYFGLDVEVGCCYFSRRVLGGLDLVQRHQSDSDGLLQMQMRRCQGGGSHG